MPLRTPLPSWPRRTALTPALLPTAAAPVCLSLLRLCGHLYPVVPGPPAASPGDTGIIQNTGSSVKGYHIMYFAGWDDPVWAVSAKNALNNEQYSQWAEKLASACTVTRGSGLKYVE